MNASKSSQSGRCARAYSARNSSQPSRSAAAYPENVGGTSGSFSSAGLHEAIRTQGRPQAGSAAKPTTLSSTTTSGSSSSRIWRRRGSTYFAPSTSACQVGWMNPSSCSIVGLRKTGAVSRMKSFQNWPGSSSCSGGGPRRIVASSKPLASRVPANDSSTTNTTRCPRRRRTSPIPTQLLVGPKAPSGKKTTVAIWPPILCAGRDTLTRLGEVSERSKERDWKSRMG